MSSVQTDGSEVPEVRRRPVRKEVGRTCIMAIRRRGRGPGVRLLAGILTTIRAIERRLVSAHDRRVADQCWRASGQ
jgi:hypothetical protein